MSDFDQKVPVNTGPFSGLQSAALSDAGAGRISTRVTALQGDVVVVGDGPLPVAGLPGNVGRGPAMGWSGAGLLLTSGFRSGGLHD